MLGVDTMAGVQQTQQTPAHHVMSSPAGGHLHLVSPTLPENPRLLKRPLCLLDADGPTVRIAAMSTEPLLPSYASATQHDATPHVRRHSARRRTSLIIPAAPVIQTLSGLTFMTTAIISTVWAYRSYVPPPELVCLSPH